MGHPYQAAHHVHSAYCEDFSEAAIVHASAQHTTGICSHQLNNNTHRNSTTKLTVTWHNASRCVLSYNLYKTHGGDMSEGLHGTRHSTASWVMVVNNILYIIYYTPCVIYNYYLIIQYIRYCI